MSRPNRFSEVKFIIRGEPDPILPTDATKPASRHCLVSNRPLARALFLGLVVFALVFVCRNIVQLRPSPQVLVPIIPDEPPVPRQPPLYDEYYLNEERLPQHDPNLPFPEGRTGRYINMENFVITSGWGNAMQELLLDAHVAYKSGRSFVFYPYTWNLDGSNSSQYGDHLIPSRIPLTAILAGPVVGQLFPDQNQPTPRAVIKTYFDKVCPRPTVISTHNISDHLENDATAKRILDAWTDKLNIIADNCVTIDRASSEQIFTFWVFGAAERILPIWPSFSTSPVLTHFRWSHLIHRAFNANVHLFSSVPYLALMRSLGPSLPPLLKDTYPHLIPSKYIYAPLPDLLVLHVRRGDFVDHCNGLSNWGSMWNGFNRFPEFLDKFALPPGYTPDGSEAPPHARAHYLKHCFPSIPQIVEKIADVLKDPANGGLKYVYVMTNGDRGWVQELKEALGGMEDGKRWQKIATRRDLELDWEQTFVSQAVDMLIGQRAQVFIGNGFSSMTSNIVTLRMANGFDPSSNRFW
ncbi:hypothetical protein BXZ70DRAFT_896563 [Cristinia sonorae]|uniref:GDP-fucose protein O-fucosyltransferase 2 n=1 Tax=Cristinia sonorae TaxID=1940300 RepID=A0A8K0ULT2_9AGAR|nr:hypothetical protein BXZ70DRAFT_896563 [Cristinia sonorae]